MQPKRTPVIGVVVGLASDRDKVVDCKICTCCSHWRACRGPVGRSVGDILKHEARKATVVNGQIKIRFWIKTLGRRRRRIQRAKTPPCTNSGQQRIKERGQMVMRRRRRALSATLIGKGVGLRLAETNDAPALRRHHLREKL